MTIGSTLTTTGLGSQALVLGDLSGANPGAGAVGGALRIQAALTSTGYSDTVRLTDNTQQTNLQKTPLDVEQSGSTATVAARRSMIDAGVLAGANSPCQPEASRSG